jgi:hypothetical protein
MYILLVAFVMSPLQIVIFLKDRNVHFCGDTNQCCLISFIKKVILMRLLAMWNATFILIIVKLSYCYANYKATETIPSVISSVQRHFFSDCVSMLHIRGNAGNFTLRMISILHYLLGWKLCFRNTFYVLKLRQNLHNNI